MDLRHDHILQCFLNCSFIEVSILFILQLPPLPSLSSSMEEGHLQGAPLTRIPQMPCARWDRPGGVARLSPGIAARLPLFDTVSNDCRHFCPYPPPRGWETVLPELSCLELDVSAGCIPLLLGQGGSSRSRSHCELLAFAEHAANLPFTYRISSLPMPAGEDHQPDFSALCGLEASSWHDSPAETAKSSNYLCNSLGTEQYLAAAYCAHTRQMGSLHIAGLLYPLAPAQNPAYDPI